MRHTDPILDDLHFPEGPRPYQGGILFSDFYQYAVIAVDENGNARTICRVANQPSGLGFNPGGDLLIVSMLDRRLLKLTASALVAGHSEPPLVEVADLSSLVPSTCNDMVVDSKGRAYIGNFGFDHQGGEAPRSTNLIRVDPNGHATEAATDLMFPNGTVITPDGETLIVAESRGRRLTAFRIDDRGDLHDRRIWADLNDRVPDGICLDAEGAIWVADPRKGGVFRVHEGGKISSEIATPERNAYACMLSGPNRQTLFVCTAEASGSGAQQKRSGRIEVATVDVPGAGWP